MTTTPPGDPLVALWHSAPEPDTRHLLLELGRFNRLHRRFNWSILAILCGMAILLLFEETTGRLATHGILSAIWIGGVVIGALWHKRERCNHLNALTSDMDSLLKAMLARAKSDLFVARCLYAGAPLGAGISFMVFKVAGSHALSPTAKTNSHGLEMIQTEAGVVALVIMIAVGVILARSRSEQVRDLSEKLIAFETDL
jgi:hypothetical protein